MPSNVKVSASWKTVSALYTRVGGSWKNVAEGYTKIGGAWKQFFSSNALVVDHLVIAGGGSGGGYVGGGGGAGGYRTSLGTSGGGAAAESRVTVAVATNYTVTVGAGGAGTFNTRGNNGSNSVFATVTSTGGGTGAVGGGGNTNTGNGGNGGSGGGGGSSTGNLSGGTGTTAQGFGGGNSSGMSGDYGSGGGGGAGVAGETPAATTGGGNGGNGVASTITGTSVTRAGGGGGANGNAYGSSVPGTGGSGGGGNGALHNMADGATVTAATAGTANTGGGGGGGGIIGSQAQGLNGGSGVVILSYPSTFDIRNGAGLTYTTSVVGSNKVTVFTAGTGNIQFADAVTSSFVLLETVTLTSAQASVEFANLNSKYSALGYQHLQVRMVVRTTRSNTADFVKVTFNADTTGYARHAVYGNGSSVVSYGLTDIISTPDIPGNSAGSGQFGAVVMDILDAFETTKNKTTRALGGASGSVNRIQLDSGLWIDTSAITSIKLESGNASEGAGLATGTRFSIYGLRGS